MLDSGIGQDEIVGTPGRVSFISEFKEENEQYYAVR
jgi:hypothetical protein